MRKLSPAYQAAVPSSANDPAVSLLQDAPNESSGWWMNT
jgi:hypothetical protein